MKKRRGVNPNATKYIKRRLAKNTGQLIARNTPGISEGYKHYQNLRNASGIYRDGIRFIKNKVREKTKKLRL